MLYLEDFLEMIEPLPEELRNRFTEIRELDLKVQNALDRQDSRVEQHFATAGEQRDEQRDKNYARIKLEYAKIVESADAKVNIASNMHELLEKYERKLQEQLTKFKLELEADNPGLTQIIEDKYHTSEHHLREQRRLRKRKQRLDAHKNRCNSSASYDDEDESVAEIVAKYGRHDETKPSTSGYAGAQSSRRTPSSSNRLSSQAAAEQNAMLVDILKSASSQMSNDPMILKSVRPSSPDLMPPPPAGLGSLLSTQESRHGRPRKPSHRVQEMMQASMSKISEKTACMSTRPPLSFTVGGDDSDDSDIDDDTARRWCICNKTSYGGMVACDSQECPFEWFHYTCVGIAAPPKGKWFCPHCVSTMKRRML